MPALPVIDARRRELLHERPERGRAKPAARVPATGRSSYRAEIEAAGGVVPTPTATSGTCHGTPPRQARSQPAELVAARLPDAEKAVL